MSSHEHGMMNKHKHRESEKDGSSEESGEEKMADQHHSHVHIHLNVGTAQGHGHSHSHQTGTNKCHGPGGEYSLDEYIHAKCDMMPNNAVNTGHNVRGTVYLRQKPNQPLEVKVNIYGFNTKHNETMGRSGKLHGFHVHEFGDFQNGCNSFGGHYNPEGHDHGGPDGEHKHTGDWGNIQTDHRGVAIATFEQSGYLYGPQSLVGRGIVVHAGEDDHGMAGTHSSRTTGSAGSRVACCVIAMYKGGVW